jgi:hypothetical protein
MKIVLVLCCVALFPSCASQVPGDERPAVLEREKARHDARPIGAELVGAWNDKMFGVAGRITIVRKRDGTLVCEWAHKNGEKTQLRLEEVETGRRFRVVGNSHGDNFRVKPDGDLEMWDCEGFIRTVKRAQ